MTAQSASAKETHVFFFTTDYTRSAEGRFFERSESEE